MALHFFHGLTINLMPVLMKNEGEKLCDGESVHIIQKVIMTRNGAAAPHPSGWSSLAASSAAHHTPWKLSD